MSSLDATKLTQSPEASNAAPIEPADSHRRVKGDLKGLPFDGSTAVDNADVSEVGRVGDHNHVDTRSDEDGDSFCGNTLAQSDDAIGRSRGASHGRCSVKTIAEHQQSNATGRTTSDRDTQVLQAAVKSSKVNSCTPSDIQPPYYLDQPYGRITPVGQSAYAELLRSIDMPHSTDRQIAKAIEVEAARHDGSSSIARYPTGRKASSIRSLHTEDFLVDEDTVTDSRGNLKNALGQNAISKHTVTIGTNGASKSADADEITPLPAYRTFTENKSLHTEDLFVNEDTVTDFRRNLKNAPSQSATSELTVTVGTNGTSKSTHVDEITPLPVDHTFTENSGALDFLSTQQSSPYLGYGVNATGTSTPNAESTETSKASPSKQAHKSRLTFMQGCKKVYASTLASKRFSAAKKPTRKIFAPIVVDQAPGAPQERPAVTSAAGAERLAHMIRQLQPGGLDTARSERVLAEYEATTPRETLRDRVRRLASPNSLTPAEESFKQYVEGRHFRTAAVGDNFANQKVARMTKKGTVPRKRVDRFVKPGRSEEDRHVPTEELLQLLEETDDGETGEETDDEEIPQVCEAAMEDRATIGRWLAQKQGSEGGSAAPVVPDKHPVAPPSSSTPEHQAFELVQAMSGSNRHARVLPLPWAASAARLARTLHGFLTPANIPSSMSLPSMATARRGAQRARGSSIAAFGSNAGIQARHEGGLTSGEETGETEELEDNGA